MRLHLILLLGFVSLAAHGAETPSIFPPSRSVRNLSLDEAIRQALEKNLSIKVARFDPVISRYEFMASKGIYDPLFTFQYRHREETSASVFDPDFGFTRAGSSTTQDRYSPGLGGYLPSGLTYNLSGVITHNEGTEGTEPRENYAADVGIALEQPLLKNFWIDGPRTEIQLRKRDLRISELGVEEQVRTVVRDVQVAYYNLVAAREEVTVNETNVALAELLLDTVVKEVAAGRRAPVETNQPLATFKTAQADLIAALQTYRTFENQLKSLVSDDYQAWLNIRVEPTDKLILVPERLDMDALAESWVAALNKRPDLRQLSLAAEKVELTRRLRRNQLFPELNLFGGYGRSGVDSLIRTNFIDPGPPVVQGFRTAREASFSRAIEQLSDESNPSWNIGFSVAYPLGNRAERNLYKSAKESQKQLDAQIHLRKHEVLVEVQIAMEAAVGARERISARWQAVQAAQVALQAERDKLAAGTSTFVQVTEVQEDYIRALSAHIGALSTYNRALAELFFSDGTILERNRINVQFK